MAHERDIRASYHPASSTENPHNSCDTCDACDSPPMGMRVGLLLAVSALVACGKKDLDTAKTTALFTEVVVDTAPGLSGLAADDQGRLWTVAERGEKAYRITLDATLTPTIETFSVTGVTGDTDLEGIEELGGGKFAFGTERREEGVATVLLGELKGDSIAVEQPITLTADQIGIPIARNHGAEGICGAGTDLIVAIEGAGTEGGKRWAPVLRVVNGQLARRHRVWLTSDVGKLSALDCTIDAHGTATVWAVERHFEVSKILQFTLPAVGAGTDDITPRVALDLGAVLESKRNLEGIAHLPDGRIVTVADNQWRTIEGPSKLQVFMPGVVK